MAADAFRLRQKGKIFRSSNLIFATVGTHNQGFDRLVISVDELVGLLDEPVIIQYGSSSYRPRKAQGFPFDSSLRITELTQKANAVISHAAAGAILVALQLNKPLVVVPRMKFLNEVFDEHQLQLSKALDAAGIAIAVYNPNGALLKSALLQAVKQTRPINGNNKLIIALRNKLNTWKNEKL